MLDCFLGSVGLTSLFLLACLIGVHGVCLLDQSLLPPTIDSRLQEIGRRVLDSGLQDAASSLDHGTAAPGQTATTRILGALVALDPQTREVRALVDGPEGRLAVFSRAILDHRQAGTALKPILYAAALQSGAHHPGEVLEEPEEPVSWIPRNYQPGEQRTVTLRQALAASRSTVTVRLAASLPQEALAAVGRALGLRVEMDPGLSTSLGNLDLTLLELTNAYATFAAGGVYQKPSFTRTGRRKAGKTTLSNAAENRVVREEVAREVTLFLQEAYRATGGHSPAPVLPLAGKGGSNPSTRDVWFIGYSQRLVVGVWLGSDGDAPDLRSGKALTRVAGHIWTGFMEAAVRADLNDGPRADPR